MSLCNIASLLYRVWPQGVYGDRQISVVNSFWVSFLCVDQIEASTSSPDKPSGSWTFEDWFGQIPSLTPRCRIAKPFLIKKIAIYNIPSLRDRARPWGVYEDRQISIVLPFWVVHLQHPPPDKPLGTLTFEGWSVHISPFPAPPLPPRGKNCWNSQPNFFVEGKIDDRDFLLVD